MTARSQPTVLVVDDDPGILRLVSFELMEQGFHVLAAADGSEALSIAAGEAPDLVLLDLLLPDMSGLDVMNQLHEQRNVPVILLTAMDTERYQVEGLNSGAEDYIGKPFSVDELTARVRAVLRRTTGVEERPRVIRVGELEIDLNRRLVTKSGELAKLT